MVAISVMLYVPQFEKLWSRVCFYTSINI